MSVAPEGTEAPRPGGLAGRSFFKMSGSGNDFVVFDVRSEPVDTLASPETIQAICSRRTGVGADGLVLIERPSGGDGPDFGMRYFNSDGSRASLCGNAALCSTALAVRLGAARQEGLSFLTDSGVIAARLRDGLPEIDLQPVSAVQLQAPIERESGEERIGYARAGVPHLVVLCSDVAAVDVERRGAALRRHPSTSPDGANVNFVSPAGPGRWRMRTFERGVEGETLACGTGAVASAILLTSWSDQAQGDTPTVELETRSGRTLGVRLRRDGDRWLPALRGEGRIVFEGRLRDV
jgi:diaminopimelate epimerase